MLRLVIATALFAGLAPAQQALEANSIVVTANKTVVLIPTDATFSLNVSADLGFTLDQVLAALDLGLTPQDLIAINSYPIGPPPPVGNNFSRINYVFRLSMPFAKIKETVDKLEKLRKSLESGMDLTYTTISVGPSRDAVDEAHDKALADLIADAKKRAQELATAAQLKLGAIQAVNEGFAYTGGPGPVPTNVTFSVIVRFAAQ